MTSSESEVTRAIDDWSRARGLGVRRPEHAELAAAIVARIDHRFRYPSSDQAVILDFEDGRYTHPRLVDWDGTEETLYPEDEATGEPVEEAVAAYVFPLPDPDAVPEI